MDKRPASEQVEQLSPQEAEEVESLGAVVEEEGRAEPGNMKIDLHCHSEASHDCSTPLDLFPARCRERGVWIQALTDHNETWGAQKLQEMVEEEKVKKENTVFGFPPLPPSPPLALHSSLNSFIPSSQTLIPAPPASHLSSS